MNVNYATGFHDQAATYTEAGQAIITILLGHWDTKYDYTFDNFFHPFVGKLIKRLNRESLPGLMDPKWQKGLETPFFDALYHPQERRPDSGRRRRRQGDRRPRRAGRTPTTTGSCSFTSR